MSEEDVQVNLYHLFAFMGVARLALVCVSVPARVLPVKTAVFAVNAKSPVTPQEVPLVNAPFVKLSEP